MALQGKNKTVALMQSCRDAYARVPIDRLAKLRYVPLNFSTVHIHVFFDAPFPNLTDMHSQVGFVFFFADGNNKCNLFHCSSIQATRRPASTEEAEILALNFALLRLRNQRRIMLQLLQKEVPVVVYMDKQTLWQNLMNSTALSMPEVLYRCREHVNDEMLNNMCLIESKFNPADAMTKQNPNPALLNILYSHQHEIPCRQVFMLQHSLYRNSSFITTRKVPMQEDISPTQQLLRPSSSSSPAALQPPSLAQLSSSTSSPSRATASQYLFQPDNFRLFPTPAFDNHRHITWSLFPVTSNCTTNHRRCELSHLYGHFLQACASSFFKCCSCTREYRIGGKTSRICLASSAIPARLPTAVRIFCSASKYAVAHERSRTASTACTNAAGPHIL